MNIKIFLQIILIGAHQFNLVQNFIWMKHLQKQNIDPIIVPTVGMTFKDVDDAYKFYKRYAYEVGFPLKKYREKTFSKWINCSREGKSAPKSNDTPRMRNRTSGRTQCKAGI